MIGTSAYDRIARAGLEACAEALFPVNDIGAPDYRDTVLVARTVRYLQVLPRTQRRLITLLFAFFELAAPILSLSFHRFSGLPVARREALVRRLRKSRVLPFRILGDAVKATLTMMYMSHPLPLAYVGEKGECLSGRARTHAAPIASPRSIPPPDSGKEEAP